MSNFNREIVLLVWICLVIGCGGKTTPTQPLRVENLPAPPAGMQRFEGISNERVPNEWEAYQQAWSRAMERAGQFISTHIQSEILQWNQEATQETFGKRIVNVETLFQSTTQASTNVTLNQVYEVEQQRQQYPDGSWKARVILLAPVERLLADAQQAEAELQRELATVQAEAEQAVRILKAHIRGSVQQAETEIQLPSKLVTLERALPLYAQFQKAQASIQRARQAKASRNGLEALHAYQQVPLLTGDAPPADETPIPDVALAYQGAWESVKAAIALLESAQKGLKSGALERVEKELGAYHERMGDATGPFTHARTGETLRLPILPELLREQLKAQGQIQTLLLTFISTGLTQAQIGQFDKQFAEKLRQVGYTITTQTDGNPFEVRGDLEMRKAPIGALVTLNLSITLSLWRNRRPLAEGIHLSSGAQMGPSEDEAFAAAQRALVQKCVVEIDKQIKVTRIP